MKYKCFCCGFRTLEHNPEDPTLEICPVCFWGNDPLQNEKPDYLGGANDLSLNQSKINYQRFNAVEERFIKYVRKPLPEETI
ncbi:MAG TPA: hydrolase [Clostridiales bacterium]|nr:hydrolase [Clostridiales bacterium]